MIEITVAEHEVNDQAIAALGDDPDLYQATGEWKLTQN